MRIIDKWWQRFKRWWYADLDFKASYDAKAVVVYSTLNTWIS